VKRFFSISGYETSKLKLRCGVAYGLYVGISVNFDMVMRVMTWNRSQSLIG